jgi:hypothetical protein
MRKTLASIIATVAFAALPASASALFPTMCAQLRSELPGATILACNNRTGQFVGVLASAQLVHGRIRWAGRFTVHYWSGPSYRR